MEELCSHSVSQDLSQIAHYVFFISTPRTSTSPSGYQEQVAVHERFVFLHVGYKVLHCEYS